MEIRTTKGATATLSVTERLRTQTCHVIYSRSDVCRRFHAFDSKYGNMFFAGIILFLHIAAVTRASAE